MTDHQIGLPEAETTVVLSFRRSFWILFSAVLVMQSIEVLITVHYWPLDHIPPDFRFSHDLMAVGWYAMLLGAVALDYRLHNLSLTRAINFDPSAIAGQVPNILKYFLGTGVVVTLLSLLQEGSELGLEGQDPRTILLSFLVTVIIAPVVEEVAFRGYLYPTMFPTFTRKKERMVVNAMLFASAHVFLVAFLLGAPVPYYVFVLGYLLAKLYEESGSVVPGIVLHALNNGLVFALDILRFQAAPGSSI